MSNFKGWTTENFEAAQKQILSRRLDKAQPHKKDCTCEDCNASAIANMSDEQFKKNCERLMPAKPYHSPILDELTAMVTPEALAKTEKRMMKMLNPKQSKAQPEYKIQAAFVKEMARLFPGVMVFSDCAAHIKKTLFQQQRANALSTQGEKWPDVFIAQPSGDFAGLYLEFKAETPYKVDGVTLRKNEHNEAQAATMERLSNAGYKCAFVWTVEMAIGITTRYLNL